MVAGGRNVRMNRQQMESRRKKQQIRWKSLLVRVAVLVVIAGDTAIWEGTDQRRCAATR